MKWINFLNIPYLAIFSLRFNFTNKALRNILQHLFSHNQKYNSSELIFINIISLGKIGVFRTLSNIYNGAFKYSVLLAVNYF